MEAKLGQPIVSIVGLGYAGLLLAIRFSPYSRATNMRQFEVLTECQRRTTIRLQDGWQGQEVYDVPVAQYVSNNSVWYISNRVTRWKRGFV